VRGTQVKIPHPSPPTFFQESACFDSAFSPFLSSNQTMAIQRNQVDETKLNKDAHLPFELRLKDFVMAMQDVYDFFHDVNVGLVERGLERLDDTLRPAIMSGLLSDMLTASVGKHSRTLTPNCYFKRLPRIVTSMDTPDLVVRGVYPQNCIKAGSKGVEIKTTRKSGRRRRYSWCTRSVDVCVCLLR
jgi:hypothetical protein